MTVCSSVLALSACRLLRAKAAVIAVAPQCKRGDGDAAASVAFPVLNRAPGGTNSARFSWSTQPSRVLSCPMVWF